MHNKIKKPAVTMDISRIEQYRNPVVFRRGFLQLQLFHGVQYHRDVIEKRLRLIGFKPLKIYPEGTSWLHKGVAWTPGFAYIIERIWVDNIGVCDAILEFEPDTGKVARVVLLKQLREWSDSEKRRNECIDGNTRDELNSFVFGEQSAFYTRLRIPLERSFGFQFNAVIADDDENFKYLNARVCDLKTLQIRPSPAALCDAKNSPTSLYLRSKMEEKLGAEKLKDRETYELIYGYELLYIND